MSEFSDAKQQTYATFDYPKTTRPVSSQAYPTFAAHHSFSTAYVPTQAQLPSGLPPNANDFSEITTQLCGPYDPTYYAPADVSYPAYLEAGAASRPLPHVISYTPNQGRQRTKVTVYFRSAFDFDQPPIKTVMMFGRRRCESILQKTAHSDQTFQYALSADAPLLTDTESLSPQVPLHLVFEDSPLVWDADSLEFGHFTYLDSPACLPLQTAPASGKKRKLSLEASPRRSPEKKPSYQHLTAPTVIPVAPSVGYPPSLRTPGGPDVYAQARRVSIPEYARSRQPSVAELHTQQYLDAQQPSLQPTNSPAWSYYPSVPSVTRSPSVATVSGGGSGRASQLLPSPAIISNPTLIRTSTLHHSPTTTGIPGVDHGFNPYAMPAKAELKIKGDLDAMTKEWSDAEWNMGRRLVQFRRSQTGSQITTTFGPVKPQDFVPNSICVSCIWWAGKKECYVTSVDTIALLESLVAVRFTVEEKNRIRRNLEGYHPTTVSKTKADSEAFFKLIMGFPNPKPRNIEKDVKVFPWRILPRALTKIIGKYSASYSSTAGSLPAAAAGPGYMTTTMTRPEAGIEHMQQQQPAHLGTSPHSVASSTTSHSHAYAVVGASQHPYSPHALSATGLGFEGGPYGMAALPDSLATAPVAAMQQTATSWHPASMATNYTTDLTGVARNPWDLSSVIAGSENSYHHHHRYHHVAMSPSVASMAYQPRLGINAADGRFAPMRNYQRGHSHPTSTS